MMKNLLLALKSMMPGQNGARWYEGRCTRKVYWPSMLLLCALAVLAYTNLIFFDRYVSDSLFVIGLAISGILLIFLLGMAATLTIQRLNDAGVSIFPICFLCSLGLVAGWIGRYYHMKGIDAIVCVVIFTIVGLCCLKGSKGPGTNPLA